MKLIRHLIGKFHHRLDRAQAQTQTIGEYIQSFPKGIHSRQVCGTFLNSSFSVNLDT